MKKTRIIATLILAVITVFTLSFTAFAEEDAQMLGTAAAPNAGTEAPEAGDEIPENAVALDSVTLPEADSAKDASIGGDVAKDTATDASADTQTQQKKPSAWSSILSLGIPILILVAFFYFGMYKPQKKQEKEKKEMMDSLKVGAEVMTIGGIMGRIVTIRDESVVIESGSDKNKLEISKQAISTVK